MSNLNQELLDFVVRTERHGSLATLIDDFSQVIERQGFHAFIITGLPAGGADVEPMVIANHWPEEWTARYREQGYFPDDPVSKWSLKMDRPFRWAEARLAHPETPRTRQIASEAAELGLMDGIAFPLGTARRSQVVVSLASSQRLLIDKAREALLFAAIAYFQMSANALMQAGMRANTALSSREKEILNWLAIGKTAWETATILKLSPATVRAHIRSIHTKLDTTSTTHAVTIAIRNKFIHA